EPYVVGRARRAVVEVHARREPERDRVGVLGCRPAARDPGHEVALLVEVGEPVVDHPHRLWPVRPLERGIEPDRGLDLKDPQHPAALGLLGGGASCVESGSSDSGSGDGEERTATDHGRFSPCSFGRLSKNARDYSTRRATPFLLSPQCLVAVALLVATPTLPRAVTVVSSRTAGAARA